MRREKVQQIKLRFEEDSAWRRLPEETRTLCKELLCRLLQDVVRAESIAREVDDEREDQS